MLAIRLQIRHDSNPATVIPLLRWLSTKHNLIDLAEKAFPTSKSKSTSKKIKDRACINRGKRIANMNDANINRGFENSIRKCNGTVQIIRAQVQKQSPK
jgi:hypothetical protein